MKYIIILFIIAGAGLYLYWAYARIYVAIGESTVTNPTIRQVVDIGSSSAAKKITYIALGDSVTAGVGATAEDRTYPYQLGQLLADAQSAQVRVVNLAWPGATAADVLKNQVPLVSQFKPDIITIAIGTNDMHNRVPAREFQRTISAIVDAVATSTARVQVINIPFIGSRTLFWPPYRTYFDLQIKRYNSLLKAALAGRQVNSIDLYSLTRHKAFTDNSYYSADHFHPSDDGYKFWSKTLYDHLNF